LIYAGTGIDEGSNPYLEWDELELKTSKECLSVNAYIHRKRLLVSLLFYFISDSVAK